MCPSLRLYHPGDALFVPDQPVETLLVPLHASWLKTAEAISFLRAVRPERAFGIHDAQINSRGLQAANSWPTDQGRHPIPIPRTGRELRPLVAVTMR